MTAFFPQYPFDKQDNPSLHDSPLTAQASPSFPEEHVVPDPMPATQLKKTHNKAKEKKRKGKRKAKGKQKNMKRKENRRKVYLHYNHRPHKDY